MRTVIERLRHAPMPGHVRALFTVMVIVLPGGIPLTCILLPLYLDHHEKFATSMAASST
jgi:hypothetical protein